MKKPNYIISIALFFGLLSGSNQNFLPMQVGKVWQYENGISIHVTDSLIVDNQPYFKLTRENESMSVFPISDGCYPSEFYYTVNPGESWCDANIYALSTDSQESFKIIDFHYPENEIYNFFPTSDSSEIDMGESYISEILDVETPSGTYTNCYQIIYHSMPGAMDYGFSFYFAEDVGIVQISSSWIPNSGLINVLDVDDIPEIEFYISDVYPNPFNAGTTLNYSLSSFQRIQISVHNILGQQMQILKQGYYSAGDYQLVWNPENNFSSGNYIIQIKSGNKVLSKKLQLIK